MTDGSWEGSTFWEVVETLLTEGPNGFRDFVYDAEVNRTDAQLQALMGGFMSSFSSRPLVYDLTDDVYEIVKETDIGDCNKFPFVSSVFIRYGHTGIAVDTKNEWIISCIGGKAIALAWAGYVQHKFDDVPLDAVKQMWHTVVGLARLLEAERTPLVVAETKPTTWFHTRKRPKGKGWTTRYVRLSKDAVYLPASRSYASSTGMVTTDGKMLAPTRVRGHLKRVRFGPARAETKWVYVAPHDSRRWVSTEPTVVRVTD